jgi:hypothetical protein
VVPYSAYKPPEDVRDIVPLALGNRWDYRCVGWSCMGSDTIFGSMAIIDTFSLSDTLYYVYQSSCENIWREEFYETVDRAGCTRFFAGGFRSYIPVWPVHLLKTPIERGRGWVAAEWDTMYHEFGFLKIVAVDSTVVVAGRAYEHSICVRGIRGDESYRLYFIVPGVGIVKEELGGGLFGGQMELIGKNF